eukprot:COSAG01_NODE_7135_length_3335_cov_7.411001_3_plen_95_part_00
MSLSKKDLPLWSWKWADVVKLRDKQPRPWLFTFQGTPRAPAAQRPTADRVEEGVPPETETETETQTEIEIEPELEPEPEPENETVSDASYHTYI